MTVEYLDSLRLHKKRRRYADVLPASLDNIPAEWRNLLVQWLRFGGNSRWDTLIKKAGLAQKVTAETLLDWLLHHGWVVVVEARQHGDWWPYKVEWREQKQLRQQLGIPDVDDITSQWQSLRAGLLEAETSTQLLSVLSVLDAMPINRAITRAKLINSLLTWQAEERQGTYRDFSLWARGATKQISDTEWQWMDAIFDLASYSIVQHTPLLYLAADLQLHHHNAMLDLSAAPDFSALTPATLLGMTHAVGAINTWMLVENRTSFERVAKARKPNEGVIWLPGFAPGWWKSAIEHLLQIAPAPAKIACDPDPAGIAIALDAIGLWQKWTLQADVWRMGVTELQSLSVKKALNQYDMDMLNTLFAKDLPNQLKVLAEYIKLHNIKGEQEGYL
ncbi:MAG: hypothetical protein WBP13_04855 [Methylophilaceae bacterium]